MYISLSWNDVNTNKTTGLFQSNRNRIPSNAYEGKRSLLRFVPQQTRFPFLSTSRRLMPPTSLCVRPPFTSNVSRFYSCRCPATPSPLEISIAPNGSEKSWTSWSVERSFLSTILRDDVFIMNINDFFYGDSLFFIRWIWCSFGIRSSVTSFLLRFYVVLVWSILWHTVCVLDYVFPPAWRLVDKVGWVTFIVLIHYFYVILFLSCFCI